MDLFEPPNRDIWLQREAWIDKLIEDSELGSYLVSDHSTPLFMDMRIAYCAGAWLSVVVMAVSVIDAHLRETEAMDNKIGTATLLKDFYTGDDIDWLRVLRNKYVHFDLEKPVLEMNHWFDNQEEMQKNATKAMEMCVKAFFQSPGA